MQCGCMQIGPVSLGDGGGECDCSGLLLASAGHWPGLACAVSVHRKSLVCLQWTRQLYMALPSVLSQSSNQQHSHIRTVVCMPGVCRCGSLATLPALPSKLSKLIVSGCRRLQQLQDLPGSLVQLESAALPRLRQLPAVPPQLTHLNCEDCSSLAQVPALPNSLCRLICRKCENCLHSLSFPQA